MKNKEIDFSGRAVSVTFDTRGCCLDFDLSFSKEEYALLYGRVYKNKTPPVGSPITDMDCRAYADYWQDWKGSGQTLLGLLVMDANGGIADGISVPLSDKEKESLFQEMGRFMQENKKTSVQEFWEESCEKEMDSIKE